MIKFHHQMVVVKDMDAAIHLFQDVLGMELTSRGVVPSDVTLGNVDHFESPIVAEIATLDSNAGALIELGHFIKPSMEIAKQEWCDYYCTGLKELGFMVDDIQAWYKKITDAGYRTQSAPWMAGTALWTFVFYTDEGVIIQLSEDINHPDVARWERMLATPDYRTPEQIEALKKSYR